MAGNFDSSLKNSALRALENLAKSNFAVAGVQGLQRNGQTGMAAISQNSDAVFHSIALMDRQLRLTKSMPVVNAISQVYEYTLETSIGHGVDPSSFEGAGFVESHGSVERVAEVLKLVGYTVTKGVLADLQANAGGYIKEFSDIDARNEREVNAKLAVWCEKHAYRGADLFMDAQGDIDSNPSNSSLLNAALITEPRGIQAILREGNKSSRGLSQDLAGYGSTSSTVVDVRGTALNRTMIDDLLGTSVNHGFDAPLDVHVTPDQITAFRDGLFAQDRGMLSGSRIAGPQANANVNGNEGTSVETAFGEAFFKACLHKNSQVQKAANLSQPVLQTPVITSAVAAAGPVPTDLPAGSVRYAVMAIGVQGSESIAVESAVVVCAAGDQVTLTIAPVPGATHYRVYRNVAGVSAAQLAVGVLGKEGYIGRKLAAASGATTFVDKNVVIPGLEDVLFLASNEDRVQKAVLAGSQVHKRVLGSQGFADKTLYFACYAFIMPIVRASALATNVFQKIKR